MVIYRARPNAVTRYNLQGSQSNLENLFARCPLTHKEFKLALLVYDAAALLDSWHWGRTPPELHEDQLHDEMREFMLMINNIKSFISRRGCLIAIHCTLAQLTLDFGINHDTLRKSSTYSDRLYDVLAASLPSGATLPWVLDTTASS